MNSKGKSNKLYSGKIPTFAMLKRDNLVLVSNEERSAIATPFGLIQTRFCELLYTPYGENLPITYDTSEVNDLMQENDYIGAAIVLEKEIDKYPKVPMLYLDLAVCYERLKQNEKLYQVIERSYHHNKGLPIVDANYANLQNENLENKSESVFHKSSHYIHEAYPQIKIFHFHEVRDFYYSLGVYAILTENLTLLGQCYNIVTEVGEGSNKIIVLKAELDRMRSPLLSNIKFIFFILALLSVVFGVFWMIYKLGTWVF
jgi:tetratricopeptide (TPR) repeat protein